MKKIFIVLLLITLNLHQGYFLFGSETEKEIKAENKTEIEETTDQSDKETIPKNISFEAIKTPHVRIQFNDQIIEGLLMGLEADSVLINTVLDGNQKSRDHLVEQSSKISQIQRIPINDIQSITEIKRSKFGKFLVRGLLFGVATGVITGLLSGDDKSGFIRYSAEDKAVLGGILLGPVGGVIGGLTGIGAGKDIAYNLNDHEYIHKIRVITKLCGHGNQIVSIEQSNETLDSDSQDPIQKQIQIIKELDNNLYPGIPDSPSSPEIELKYWSLSCTFVGRIGGPGEDIEAAMTDAEFNKHSPAGWFGSGRSHPYTRMEKASFTFGVKRYINAKYSIGFILGKTFLGRTFGYHSQAGSLTIDSSTSIIAPIVSMNLYDIIRIGAGPALYFTEARKTSSSSSEESEKYEVTKVGLVIDTGIRVPWRSSFYGEFITQYRKVGQVKIGPFTAESYGDIAELPKTEVNYDHWLIGFGFGIRF